MCLLGSRDLLLWPQISPHFAALKISGARSVLRKQQQLSEPLHGTSIPLSRLWVVSLINPRLAWLGTLGMVVNALIEHRKTDPGTDGNETGITNPTGAPDGAAVLPSGTDVEMNGGPQFEKYEQPQQQPSEAPHLPQLSELGTGDEGHENRIYGHPPIDGSGTLEMPDVGQYGGNVTHVEQER